MKTIKIIAFLAIVVLLQGCYKEPVANFSFTYPEGYAPPTVHFKNLSTDADKFLWDFGDNGVSTDSDPVFTLAYDFVKPVVSLKASGRGGDASVSKTLGITSYYVKNSSTLYLYNVWTFFWDETKEEIMDDFDLGNLSPGVSSDVVVTNHSVIDMALESSDGTLYLVTYSYNLIVDDICYLDFTDETWITEVNSTKKGSNRKFDPLAIHATGDSIQVKDLGLKPSH